MTGNRNATQIGGIARQVAGVVRRRSVIRVSAGAAGPGCHQSPGQQVSRRSVAPLRGSLCLELLVSTYRGKAVRMPWQRTVPDPGPSPGPGPDLSPGPVSAALLAWAQAVDASKLSEKTVKQAENYLRDHRHMNYLARREFGFR